MRSKSSIGCSSVGPGRLIPAAVTQIERPSWAAAVSTSGRRRPATGRPRRSVCPPATLSDLFGNRCQLRRRTGEQRDVRARLGKSKRHGTPDASPAPVTIACRPSSRCVGRPKRPRFILDLTPKLDEAGVRAIAAREQLIGLFLRHSRNPRPVFTPKSPLRDVLAQKSGSREALAETSLERLVDICVDVEPGQVGDGERPEEREPEAERASARPRRPAPAWRARPPRSLPLPGTSRTGSGWRRTPARRRRRRRPSRGASALPRPVARPGRRSQERGSPRRRERGAAARTSASRGTGRVAAVRQRAR